MDDISELQKKIDEQGVKIDQILASAEKSRKYLFWSMMITIAVIVVPIIGLFFALPSFLTTYTDPQSLGL